MKAFFSNDSAISDRPATLAGAVSTIVQPSSGDPTNTPSRARVALYDATCAAPRVEEVSQTSPLLFIEALADKVYGMARSAGGSVPYTVIREVTENFIHADFAEPVVSILDDGRTIRFADQGPGIKDKQRALLPGFTTARSHMKDVIRGVGSGLPIVSDFLSINGGAVVIEDNLGCGTVVTIRSDSQKGTVAAGPPPSSAVRSGPVDQLPGLGSAPPEDRRSSRPRLSNRQKQVLALVLENGEAGPSLVHRELNVGLSTAHRDLASLEEAGLIRSADGKRSITPEGMSYLSSPTSL